MHIMDCRVVLLVAHSSQFTKSQEERNCYCLNLITNMSFVGDNKVSYCKSNEKVMNYVVVIYLLFVCFFDRMNL